MTKVWWFHRFRSRFAVNGETGCWQWDTLRRDGYGQVFVGGRKRYAHRVAYLTFVGPVPDGMDLDHLCRNRGCVNPAHLEPVTRQENVLRGEGIAAQKVRAATCPNGHPYTAESRDCRRRCVVCSRARGLRYMRRVRAEQKAASL